MGAQLGPAQAGDLGDGASPVFAQTAPDRVSGDKKRAAIPSKGGNGRLDQTPKESLGD